MKAAVFAVLVASAAAAPQIAQSNSRFDSAVITLVNGQTRKSTGNSYWDLPNNRTRFDSKEQGISIITLYNLGKEFGVSGSQCQYCPASATQAEYGPGASAANLGPSASAGTPCTLWQSNYTLGPIVMQVNNWCISDDSTPLSEVVELTPFGQYQGTGVTNVTNFKAGPQDASLFTIPGGASNCQKSPNCQSSLANLLSGSAAGHMVSNFGMLRDIAVQAWAQRLGATA